MNTNKLLEEQTRQVGEQTLTYLKSLAPLFSPASGKVNIVSSTSTDTTIEYEISITQNITNKMQLLSIVVSGQSPSPKIIIKAFDAIVHDMLAIFLIKCIRETWPLKDSSNLGSFEIEYTTNSWSYKLRDQIARLGKNSF